MENKMNDEMEIDLFEQFKNLMGHWKMILISFSAATLIAVIITAFFIPKQYESRISMYVNNNNSTTSGYINSSDITASRNLVSTYMELIQSDCVLEKVISRVDFERFGMEEPLTLQQLRKMLTCSQLKSTEIFEVRVRSKNPSLSTELLKKVSEVAPAEISRVFKSGSVEIVDRAKVPDKHVSPSVVKNAILGGLLGIIASCGFVVVSNLMDQKVKSAKDFENKHSVPLLGVIPDRLEV